MPNLGLRRQFHHVSASNVWLDLRELELLKV